MSRGSSRARPSLPSRDRLQQCAWRSRSATEAGRHHLAFSPSRLLALSPSHTRTPRRLALSEPPRAPLGGTEGCRARVGHVVRPRPHARTRFARARAVVEICTTVTTPQSHCSFPHTALASPASPGALRASSSVVSARPHAGRTHPVGLPAWVRSCPGSSGPWTAPWLLSNR